MNFGSCVRLSVAKIVVWRFDASQPNKLVLFVVLLRMNQVVVSETDFTEKMTFANFFGFANVIRVGVIRGSQNVEKSGRTFAHCANFVIIVLFCKIKYNNLKTLKTLKV